MAKITVLPHGELCPQGKAIEAAAGARLSDVLRRNGVDLEHACGMSCCCTTCHILIREGFASLRTASEEEEDQLGKAWGLEPCSRLGCQVRVGMQDLVIEIPKYTLNLVKEHH